MYGTSFCPPPPPALDPPRVLQETDCHVAAADVVVRANLCSVYTGSRCHGLLCGFIQMQGKKGRAGGRSCSPPPLSASFLLVLLGGWCSKEWPPRQSPALLSPALLPKASGTCFGPGLQALRDQKPRAKVTRWGEGVLLKCL